MPPWGAVVIAVASTLFGIAIEAGGGHRELGATFAVCYVLGCVGAVLAVRQSGVFTAVIQPPLLLFVADAPRSDTDSTRVSLATAMPEKAL